MLGRWGREGRTSAAVHDPALPALQPVVNVVDELRGVRHGLGGRHLYDGEHAEIQAGLRRSGYAGKRAGADELDACGRPSATATCKTASL